MVQAGTVGREAMLFAHVANTGVVLVLSGGRVCFVAAIIKSTLQGKDGCWPIQVSHNCAWFDARYHPIFGNITIDAAEDQFLVVH